MMKRQATVVTALATLCCFAVSLASLPARAEVYKCAEPDGTFSYSQTPCPAAPQIVTGVGAADKRPEGRECLFANQFAVVVARYMRAGSGSSEVFSRYGGIDAMSRGAVGVVNYVYSFRSNDNVSELRIASLAGAKCLAGSFGAFTCQSLPLSLRNRDGGCDADDAAEPSPPVAVPGVEPAEAQRAAVSRSASPAAEKSDEAVQRCKKLYRDRIDAIDAQMRKGYTIEQGERYKEQLLGLTKKLRRC